MGLEEGFGTLAIISVSVAAMFVWVFSAFAQWRKKISSQQGSASAAALTPQAVPSAKQVANLIMKRRSVFPRHYTGESFDRAEVEALLEAANWAPTHGKTEPWRFVVLRRAAQEELLDLSLKVLERDCTPEHFAKKRAKIEGKRSKDFPKVPYMIAIGMKRRANPDKEMPEWEEMCAVACAVQNLWLSATARGLAGYWCSWYAEARESADVKHFLGLEEEDRCLGVFMLGKCADYSCYRSKRGPLADKVSWRL